MSTAANASRSGRFPRWAVAALWGRRIEDAVASAALLLLAILPVLEMLLRGLFKAGIPGSTAYVQHLTLYAGFLGALIAAREGKHLTLSTLVDRLPPRGKAVARAGTSLVSTAVAASLAHASWEFVKAEMEAPARLGGWLPIWVAELILPVAFAGMALRFVWNAGGWTARGVALLGLPAAWLIGFPMSAHAPAMLWPLMGGVLTAVVFGAPLFTGMGGAALLLWHAAEVEVAAIPVETYRLVTNPSIAMVPLFTLVGFLLAEGKSGGRLLRAFQSLFGWMPGGLAIVTTLVCAFFTTFTGASGVTILALGGLLLPMLVAAGYRERFSIGLLTAAGSIGLLFPPSLPVILLGVQAQVPINELFAKAALPGALLVLSVMALGVVEARRSKVPRTPFVPIEAGKALWAAKWEILLPVVAVVALFGGFTTPVEAAAITVVYALIVQVAIHRELGPLRDLPRVLVTSMGLIGGVIAILGVAMGLTNYLVDQQIPDLAAEWVKTHVHSRFAFLLALNAFLIVVGALMDIYSAIMVVVPLILPVAAAFNVPPLHLAVIFLANLELGYLVPPVGENLFLSSYRFNQPVLRVAAYTVPFMIAILVAVLIITYLPGVFGLN